jgi:hypothetical protein
VVLGLTFIELPVSEFDQMIVPPVQADAVKVALAPLQIVVAPETVNALGVLITATLTWVLLLAHDIISTPSHFTV